MWPANLRLSERLAVSCDAMKAVLPFVSPRTMAKNRFRLSREDILPVEEYRKIRKDVFK